MTLHLLYLCNEYPDRAGSGGGGIGTSYQILAEGLARRGALVHVVGLYDALDDQLERINGVSVHRLAKRLGGFGTGILNRRRMSRYVADLVRKEAIELVESPDYEGLLWLQQDWGVVRVVRICGSETYFRKLLNEPLKLKTFLSERATLRKADHIITKSHYSWRETKRLFRLPPETRAHYIPNPVNVDYYAPTEMVQVVPGRILFTGTLIRKKGILDLFRALPRIFETVPHSHLVCVGPDSRDRLTGESSTLALALKTVPSSLHHRIDCVGRQSRSVVLKQLQAAELCILPSHLEVFPNTWLEAMACGKPLIASRTGSGPEVVVDGESGVLCDPFDSSEIARNAIRLLQAPQEAQRLASGARARARALFGESIVLRQNRECYAEFLAGDSKE